MLNWKNSAQLRLLNKAICIILVICFSLTNTQYSRGQSFNVSQLPAPGSMVGVSSSFDPIVLKGLIINPKKPLEFQFVVDAGGTHAAPALIKDQTNILVKYFLAGLTIPEKDLWVNLSPYEKDRIATKELGSTELGRALLETDYILKQLTASLIYPEGDLGKEFWSKVYARAKNEFGTVNIPTNTFNKVWIIPGKAQVFEKGVAAYVTESTLKVMLDEDFLAKEKNQSPQDSGVLSEVLRSVIVPEIEKEVNTGKNFAALRQIYNAIVLAKWYKETISNELFDSLYTDKNKINGINLSDPDVKEKIYERYLQAYKAGVFNYIKEDPSSDGQSVPRKYFSGGISHLGTFQLGRTHDNGILATVVHPERAHFLLTVDLNSPGITHNIQPPLVAPILEKNDAVYEEGVTNLKEISRIETRAFSYSLVKRSHLSVDSERNRSNFNSVMAFLGNTAIRIKALYDHAMAVIDVGIGAAATFIGYFIFMGVKKILSKKANSRNASTSMQNIGAAADLVAVESPTAPQTPLNPQITRDNQIVQQPEHSTISSPSAEREWLSGALQELSQSIASSSRETLMRNEYIETFSPQWNQQLRNVNPNTPKQTLSLRSIWQKEFTTLLDDVRPIIVSKEKLPSLSTDKAMGTDPESALVKRAILKKHFKQAALGLFLAVPMLLSSQLSQAAHFIPQSDGMTQVTIEKNDTFGQILLDAGYKGKLWGETGTVAQLKGSVQSQLPSGNVNFIKPGQQFNMPDTHANLDLKQKIEDKNAQIASVHKETSELDQENADLKAIVKDLKTRLDQAKGQLAQGQSGHVPPAEVQSLQQQRNDQEREVDQLELKKNQAAQVLIVLGKEKDKLEHEVVDLKSIKPAIQKESEKVKGIIDQLKQEADNLQGQISQRRLEKEKLDRDIKSLDQQKNELKIKLSPFKQQLDQTKNLLEKADLKSRPNFSNIWASFPKWQKIALFLLAITGVGAIIVGIIMWNRYQKFEKLNGKIATLNSEVSELERSLLPARLENEALEQQAKERRDEVASLEFAKLRQSEEIALVAQELARIQNENQQIQAAIATANAEKDKVIAEKQDQSAQLDIQIANKRQELMNLTSDVEIARATAEVVALNEEISQLQEELVSKQQEKDQQVELITHEISGLSARKNEINLEVAALEQDLTEQRKVLEIEKVRIKALKKVSAEMDLQMADANSRRGLLTQELSVLGEQMASITQEIEELKGQSNAQKEQLSQQILAAESKSFELQETLADLKRQQDAIRKTIEEAQTKKEDVETAVAFLNQKRQELSQNISDLEQHKVALMDEDFERAAQLKKDQITNELTTLASQRDGLTEQIQILQDQESALRESLERTIKGAEELTAAAAVEVAVLNKELAEFRQVKADLAGERDQLEGVIATKNTELVDISHEKDILEQNIQDFQNRKAFLNQELATIQQGIEDQKRIAQEAVSLTEEHKRAAQQILAETRQQILEQKQAADTLATTWKGMVQKKQTLEGEISTLAAIKESTSADIQKVHTELLALREENDALTSTNVALALENAGLEEHISELEAQRNRLQDDVQPVPAVVDVAVEVDELLIRARAVAREVDSLYLDERGREKSIDTFVNLVRQESPSGHEGAIRRQLKETLEKMDAKVLHECGPQCSAAEHVPQNLIVEFPATGKFRNMPGIIINAHMDTVSWTIPKLAVSADNEFYSPYEYDEREFNNGITIDGLVDELRRRGIDLPQDASLDYINANVLTDRNLFKKYPNLELTPENKKTIENIQDIDMETLLKFNRSVIDRGDHPASPEYRGSFGGDDKGGVLVQIEALRFMKENLWDKGREHRRIVFIITAEEELRYRGAEHLVSNAHKELFKDILFSLTSDGPIEFNRPGMPSFDPDKSFVVVVPEHFQSKMPYSSLISVIDEMSRRKGRKLQLTEMGLGRGDFQYFKELSNADLHIRSPYEGNHKSERVNIKNLIDHIDLWVGLLESFSTDIYDKVIKTSGIGIDVSEGDTERVIKDFNVGEKFEITLNDGSNPAMYSLTGVIADKLERALRKSSFSWNWIRLKKIVVSTGNDRLAKADSDGVITLDIDAFESEHLLALEIEHEALHVAFRMNYGWIGLEGEERKMPEAIEEILALLYETIYFLSFNSEYQKEVIELMKAENKIDSMKFVRILKKYSEGGMNLEIMVEDIFNYVKASGVYSEDITHYFKDKTIAQVWDDFIYFFAKELPEGSFISTIERLEKEGETSHTLLTRLLFNRYVFSKIHYNSYAIIDQYPHLLGEQAIIACNNLVFDKDDRVAFNARQILSYYYQHQVEGGRSNLANALKGKSLFSPDDHLKVNGIIATAQQEGRGHLIWGNAKSWKDQRAKHAEDVSWAISALQKQPKVFAKGLGQINIAKILAESNIVLIAQPPGGAPGLIVNNETSYQVAHNGRRRNSIYIDQVTYERLYKFEVAVLLAHEAILLGAKHLAAEKGIPWTEELAKRITLLAEEFERSIVGRSQLHGASRLDDSIEGLLDFNKAKALVKPHQENMAREFATRINSADVGVGAWPRQRTAERPKPAKSRPVKTETISPEQELKKSPSVSSKGKFEVDFMDTNSSVVDGLRRMFLNSALGDKTSMNLPVISGGFPPSMEQELRSFVTRGEVNTMPLDPNYAALLVIYFSHVFPKHSNALISFLKNMRIYLIDNDRSTFGATLDGDTFFIQRSLFTDLLKEQISVDEIKRRIQAKDPQITIALFRVVVHEIGSAFFKTSHAANQDLEKIFLAMLSKKQFTISGKTQEEFRTINNTLDLNSLPRIDWAIEKADFTDNIDVNLTGDDIVHLTQGFDHEFDNIFNGGIQLNQIQVTRTGKTINVYFDPSLLKAIEDSDFNGFVPVLTNIIPLPDPLHLFGAMGNIPSAGIAQ